MRAFSAVVDTWAADFAPDFGFVHALVAKADIERGKLSRTVSALNPKQTMFTMLVFTDRLEDGIPELYWRTYFGPAYIRHFGRERLLSTPAQSVTEVGETILVQLTEDMSALEHDFAHVEEVRARVRAHLGPESFFDPTRGVGAHAPDFGLPIAPIPARMN